MNQMPTDIFPQLPSARLDALESCVDSRVKARGEYICAIACSDKCPVPAKGENTAIRDLGAREQDLGGRRV